VSVKAGGLVQAAEQTATALKGRVQAAAGAILDTTQVGLVGFGLILVGVGFGLRGSSKPGQGWMAGCPQYLQPRRPSHTVSPHPRARCCSVCWRQLSRPSAPGTRSPRQPPREPSRVRTGIVSPFGTQPTPRDQQQAVLSQRWAASPTQRSGELALTPLCPALAPCPCRRGGSDRIRRRPGGWSGGEGA
jgi:hypothetical protein